MTDKSSLDFRGLTIRATRPATRHASPLGRSIAIIRALGYLDDVDEDEFLPLSKNEISRYWSRRQPEVLKSAGRLTSGGTPPSPPTPPVALLRGGDSGVEMEMEMVRPHVRGGRQVSGYRRRRRR